VRSLTLDGNREHNTIPTAGMILRSWQTVIEDVQISHMGGHGIRLTSVSADGTELENTQVNGQIAGSFIDHSGEHGIFVEDPVNAVTDWNLIGNWIGYSGADGIHMENAAGWVIERNRVYSVLENAIYADRMYGTSISNNYIDGFGETEAAGTWYGINSTIQGETASTIANNRVFNSDSDGESRRGSTFLYIAISRVYDESGLCSVTGNVIRGAGTERGIGLSYDGENPLTVVSTGNAVVDVHTPQFVGPTVTVDSGV